MGRASAIWSNAFFLAPLVMAVHYQVLVLAVLLVGVMVFSTLYHWYGEARFAAWDKLFAYATIMCNLVIAVLGGFTMPYFALAILFVALGLYVLLVLEHDDWLWHALSSLVTVCCILTYVL